MYFYLDLSCIPSSSSLPLPVWSSMVLHEASSSGSSSSAAWIATVMVTGALISRRCVSGGGCCCSALELMIAAVNASSSAAPLASALDEEPTATRKGEHKLAKRLWRSKAAERKRSTAEQSVRNVRHGDGSGGSGAGLSEEEEGTRLASS